MGSPSGLVLTWLGDRGPQGGPFGDSRGGGSAWCPSLPESWGLLPGIGLVLRPDFRQAPILGM